VFFKNNGADMISIPTNGLNPSLVRDQLLRILACAGGRPIRVNLSLDGTERVHDEIRGVPGSFKKVVETYGLITALQTDHPNLSLGINSCVMNRNYAALMDLYSVWPGLFPRVNFPGMILLRGAPFDRSLELPNEEQLRRLFSRKLSVCPGRQPTLWRFAEWVNFTAGVRTLRLKTQAVPCEAGRILGVVDETGSVKHCEMLPSIGNIRERSFESIWTSLEAARARERIAAKECHCTHECNMFESILAHPFATMRLCLEEGLRSRNGIRLGRRSGSAGTL
jgi:MoaA/NifB/PqqE/SkfB family radical SAM enzyme